MNTFRKHFYFLLQHKTLLTGALIAGIGASLMESVGVSLLFPLLQGITGGKSSAIPPPFHYIVEPFQEFDIPRRLQIVALLFVAVMIMKGGMLILKNICSIRLRIIISDHFRTACFRQLMRVGMSYFHAQKYGDLHTILSVYVNNMGVSMSRFAQLIHLPFTVLFLLTILVLVSWQVTIISIFLTVILMMTIRTLVRRTDVVGRKLAAVTNRLNSTLFDIVTGMKIIRLFNREDDAKKKMEDAAHHLNNTTYTIGLLQGFVNPITEFAGALIVAVIMFANAVLMQHTLGYGAESMFIFLFVLIRILNPIYIINQTRVSFTGDLPYYREVFRFLETHDKYYVQNGKRPFEELRSSIEFVHVGFRYSLKGTPILNAVSLKIQKGKRIGIVGPSGAGKSTLTELLLRFYDPQEGAIFIDGVDLREFDIYSWRRHIGVVTQDTFLFHDTVRANIGYAHAQATMKEIESAARKANAHEFITALPNGYDTLLGERGVLLSGGQRQRIAIARAIVARPEILVFDEATSSLDSESEKMVQRSFDEVSEGKTVITIAHRLSTIFDSDIIYVIEHGRLIEQGTHHALLQRNGLYNTLASQQNASIKQ